MPCSIGLKIFVGDGDFINQQYSDLSRELIWLQCKGFMHTNLPSWLSLEKLRSLVLVNPQSIKDLWQRDADVSILLYDSLKNVLRNFKKKLSSLKLYRKMAAGSFAVKRVGYWGRLSKHHQFARISIVNIMSQEFEKDFNRSELC